MKKLILSAAIVLGSLTTFSAQAQASAPAEPTAHTAPVTDGYKEIKAEELPAAVTDALKKAYPTAVLTKAYVNDKKEYKLEVKVGETEGALFADETGKWIKK